MHSRPLPATVAAILLAARLLKQGEPTSQPGGIGKC